MSCNRGALVVGGFKPDPNRLAGLDVEFEILSPNYFKRSVCFQPRWDTHVSIEIVNQRLNQDNSSQRISTTYSPLGLLTACGRVTAGVPHLLPVNIAGCYGNHCGLPHEPGQERSDPERGPVNPATQKDFAFSKGASSGVKVSALSFFLFFFFFGGCERKSETITPGKHSRREGS